MFAISFWVIMLIAISCFFMDFARAKPDLNKQIEFLNTFKVFLIGFCTLLIAIIFSNFLVGRNFCSIEERAILICEAFFLILFRKALAIIAQGLNSYLCAIDNAWAQLVEPKLIVKNNDPEAGKPLQVSLGVLRIGHTVIFLISLLLFAVSAALPGVSNSRINVLYNWGINLIKLPTGSAGERIIFTIWLIMFCAFWFAALLYLWKLYRNFMSVIDKKYSEIENITGLRFFIIISFIIRKVFNYLFIMDNYRLQDFVFWWFVIAFCMACAGIWWFNCQRTGRTTYHIG